MGVKDTGSIKVMASCFVRASEKNCDQPTVWISQNIISDASRFSGGTPFGILLQERFAPAFFPAGLPTLTAVADLLRQEIASKAVTTSQCQESPTDGRSPRSKPDFLSSFRDSLSLLPQPSVQTLG